MDHQSTTQRDLPGEEVSDEDSGSSTHKNIFESAEDQTVTGGDLGGRVAANRLLPT